MYEPSRVLLSFHIAGFQYTDGALVLGDLKAGDKLTLCAERDNPHDPEAVAIYYGKTKLGYVPGNEVGPLSLICLLYTSLCSGIERGAQANL